MPRLAFSNIQCTKYLDKTRNQEPFSHFDNFESATLQAEKSSGDKGIN